MNYALSGFRLPATLSDLNRPATICKSSEDCTRDPAVYYSSLFQLVIVDSPGISVKFSVEDIAKKFDEISIYLPSEIVHVFYFVPESKNLTYDFSGLHELLKWKRLINIEVTVVNIHIPEVNCSVFLKDHACKQFPEKKIHSVCVHIPDGLDVDKFVASVANIGPQMRNRIDDINRSLGTLNGNVEPTITTGELIRVTKIMAEKEKTIFPPKPDSRIIHNGLLDQVNRKKDFTNWRSYYTCNDDDIECRDKIWKELLGEYNCNSLNDCALLTCAQQFNSTYFHIFAAFFEQMRHDSLVQPMWYVKENQFHLVYGTLAIAIILTAVIWLRNYTIIIQRN